MSLDATIGARFARWWTRAVTRTADRTVALERRAEVASDVHEQLTESWHRDALPAGSRSVIARVVRGMPSDVAWRVGLELRASRLAWHLTNPSTGITTLFVAMLPLNVAADSAGQRTWPPAELRVPIWVATDLVGVCILIFGVLALAHRVWTGWSPGGDRFQPGSRLERARRCSTAALGITLAGSAVLRFGALSPVAGAFWAAFAACVLVYGTLLAATLGSKFLTLGRYLPKVSA